MTETTGELLMAAARALRRQFAAALAEWDITPGQARALRVVSEDGPLRLSTLADRLRIAPRSATEVVDALEKRELVCRVADPTDRRATMVQPLPAGLDLRAELEEARLRASEAFLARLPKADRHTLHRILRSLGPDQ